MKLTDIETCRVGPTDSGATTKLTLPLTFLDLFWFKIPPVERLFFYKIPGLDSTRFNDSVVNKLKHSLALTLNHYLPLAGNILWPPSSPKPFLCYRPGDAVSVSVYESAADFDRLSGDSVRGAAESRPLAPSLFVSQERASVLAVSITLFPSSGFCIGVSAHHGALDGKSTILFIKSWAYNCNNLINGSGDFDLPPELSPVFDRTAIEDNPRARGLDMVHLNRAMEMMKHLSEANPRSLMTWEGHPSDDLVSCTFELSPADIEKLRTRVMKREDYVSRLSTFVLSTSYASVQILRSKVSEQSRESGDDKEEENKAVIAFPADYRARLDPPVPASYVGNCVGGHMVELKDKEWMDREGFARLAVKMSEAIGELEKGVPLERENHHHSKNKPSKPKYGFIGIAGSNRFGVYRVDFGWGMPEKVAIQSIERTRAISIAESRDKGGGVEIGVVLNKFQMERFQDLFAKDLM